MNQQIEKLVARFPRLSFLKTPQFQALSTEDQEYILELIDDAKFWYEEEKRGRADRGFKFLASTFGLTKAQQDAEAKGLSGKDREEFLQPHQELYTQYNPYSGRTSDDR